MAKKPEPPEGTASQLTFEQSLAELEAVVRILEDGQIGLDESLVKYEEGIRLLQCCRQSLQQAERKILLLTGIDEQGNPVVEPFEDTGVTLEEKKEARTRRRSRAPNVAGGCDEATDGDSDRQKGLF